MRCLVGERTRWSLYLTACFCGAIVIGFCVWYVTGSDGLLKLYRKMLGKKEPERSFISKVTIKILSPVVVVVNRIVKTTTNILLLRVSLNI